MSSYRPAGLQHDDDDRFADYLTSGTSMRRVLQMAARVAESNVTVLITGESGVGKEVIARQIHRRSARRRCPFIKVNCAALPMALLESELFGHERGAFTGAGPGRPGKFAAADTGTILLDEIGELPASLQAKLLHVLQDRAFTPLGSNEVTTVDVRVIAATNRDLTAMIGEGRFREDLYYRLQVIEIHIPPLRERRDEIATLAGFFLNRHMQRFRRRVTRLSPRVRRAFVDYDWPGNIRELENMVKRLVILGDESLILNELRRQTPRHAVPTGGDGSEAAAPAEPPDPDHAPIGRLADIAQAAARAAEAKVITRALDRCRWNRRQAAGLLGVSYKTLLKKIKQCKVTPPPPPFG